MDHLFTSSCPRYLLSALISSGMSKPASCLHLSCIHMLYSGKPAPVRLPIASRAWVSHRKVLGMLCCILFAISSHFQTEKRSLSAWKKISELQIERRLRGTKIIIMLKCCHSQATSTENKQIVSLNAGPTSATLSSVPSECCGYSLVLCNQLNHIQVLVSNIPGRTHEAFLAFM